MKTYKKILSLRGAKGDAAISANKQITDSGVRTRLPRALCALAMTILLWAAPAFAASTTKICCYVPSPSEGQGNCVADQCYDCIYSTHVQMGASLEDAIDICYKSSSCPGYGLPNHLCVHDDWMTECGVCSTVGTACSCYNGSGTIEPRNGPNCPSGETQVACSNISTTTNLGAGTMTCQETGPSPREIAVADCKQGSLYATNDLCYGGTAYCSFVANGYSFNIDIPVYDCSSENFPGCDLLISIDPSLCDTMYQ